MSEKTIAVCLNTPSISGCAIKLPFPAEAFSNSGKKVADFLDKMGSAASNATQLREEPVSAMAIATGMASILGGSALLATIQDKMEKGEFGEKGKKVADFLQKVSKGATARRYGRNDGRNQCSKIRTP